MTEDDEEKGWLREVAGDVATRREAAAAYLQRRYTPRLRRLFTSLGAHREDVEDLIQETLIRAFSAASRFRAEAKVSTWMRRIAANRFWSHLTYRQQREMINLPPILLDLMNSDDLGDAADHAESGYLAIDVADQRHVDSREQLFLCIERAFQQWSNRYPEKGAVLRMIIFEDLGIAAIAERLGRTPGATRQYLSECRKSLRKTAAPCREFLGE